MAEAILAHRLREAGIDPAGLVDSAGTGGWHVGEPPDPRTRDLLQAKGIPWLTRARQVRRKDFQDFDHIVALDAGHVRELLAWTGSDPAKVSLCMAWCGEDGTDVPDPYYGPVSGFHTVYEMCDRACRGIVERAFTK